MPVLVRNRSWEQHIPHGAGLQYSYDDMDIVFCHKVAFGGLSSGPERGKCASLPTRGHRLPPEWYWFSANGDRATVTGQEPSRRESVVDGTGVLDRELKVDLKGQSEDCKPPCGDHTMTSEPYLTNGFASEVGLSHNIPQDVLAEDSKKSHYDVSQGDSKVQGELAMLPNDENPLHFVVSDQPQGDDSNLIQADSFDQEPGTANHSAQELLSGSNAAGSRTFPMETRNNDNIPLQNGDSDPLCCTAEPYHSKDIAEYQGIGKNNNLIIGQLQSRNVADSKAVPPDPSSIALQKNVIEDVLNTRDKQQKMSEVHETAKSEECITRNWKCSFTAYNTTVQETCQDVHQNSSDLVSNQTFQECQKDEDSSVNVAAAMPSHDTNEHRECYSGTEIKAVTEERSHNAVEDQRTFNEQIATRTDMETLCLVPHPEMTVNLMTSRDACPDLCEAPCDGDFEGSAERTEKSSETTLLACDFSGLSDSMECKNQEPLMACNSPDQKTGVDTNLVLSRPQGNMDHRSRKADIRHGLELEDDTVKLRVRKAAREERKCPRVDSMALLIMKLDQLDHEIDSALSSSASRTQEPQGHAPALAKKDKAEIEAGEACTWLRAAGFPQYAQLYEDGQFPINISSVTWDHDFLDRDAIEALCRRLNTLNKCTMMKLEISPKRKQSEDSEEDEPCAISGRWTFQRASKRWSRLEELEVFPPLEGPGSSSESLLTDPGWPSAGTASSGTVGNGTTRTGSLASVCSSGTSGATEDSPSEGPPSPPSPGIPGFPYDHPSKSPAKSARSKARSFLRRMESLRLRGTSSRRRKKSSLKLEISGPVLKQGPDEERLRQLHCVDVSILRERSVSCSGQAAGSSGSSASEPSGGSSTVSTPSPVTRARSHSTAGTSAKRIGMYLENFDPLSLLQVHTESLHTGGIADLNRRNRKVAVCTEEDDEEEEEQEIFFFIPEGHKPGTFPKALCNGRPSSCDTSLRSSTHRRGASHRRNSSGSLDSRLSFYDNVPPQEEAEEEEESLAYKLDDVLRGFPDPWTERADRVGEDGDSDSALDSASPCPSSPLQSHLEEAENGSDLDSTLNEPDVGLIQHERRDSGVGASLTRSNSRPPKLRWPSFQSSHRPSLPSAPLQLSAQSVLQMNLLQKFSLLKITALLEKHAPINKHGFSWAVPKFMKRTKVREHRGRSVFGVPLRVNVQRTGQPLPLGIQQAMRYLRSQCLDQVGLFRKSGVKSRIQALRQMNEVCLDGVSYEGQSAYDVADMLKQYFRDLPEPLLTNKLSETFLQIYQYVPKEQRLQAAKAAALLLPDENREVLEALLCFLSDVAAAASDNQMTCTNLAVCLAPSLFHLNAVRRDGSSPRVMQRKQNLGKPDQRDLNENLAATQGLAHMITECRKLFQIPEDMSFCRNSYMEQELLPAGLEELEQGVGVPCLRDTMESLLKEAKDRFRGYDSCSTHEQQVELAYKKVHDGFPLRLWKASVEVAAAPDEVLTRLLRERDRWDEDLLEVRVLETLDHNTDIYQYVQDSMAPRPPRDHVVLRMWATDLPKGACALVCASVDHQGAPLMGVKANVLAARYYMEPCGSGRTRLTYISRVDCRGHFPEWYNKVFGHWCAAEVAQIRDSFASSLDK